MNLSTYKPKFQPEFKMGEMLVTKGIYKSITLENIFALIRRFSQKDWGELSEDDIEMNQIALANGDRLFGRYTVNEFVIYIITEADRSCTTVLLSDEYWFLSLNLTH